MKYTKRDIIRNRLLIVAHNYKQEKKLVEHFGYGIAADFDHHPLRMRFFLDEENYNSFQTYPPGVKHSYGYQEIDFDEVDFGRPPLWKIILIAAVGFITVAAAAFVYLITKS